MSYHNIFLQFYSGDVAGVHLPYQTFSILLKEESD